MLDFSKNYFELFGLPVAYAVDIVSLAEPYRELQRITHPDRYADASDAERRISVQAAALVNEAYATLKDPMQRSRYLISLYAQEMNPDNETSRDGAFLMQQMELREELEAAASQADPYAVTARLSDQVRADLKGLDQAMQEQFAQLKPPSLQDTDTEVAQAVFEACKELARKMQFLQKLQRQIDEVEAGFDDLL